MVSIEPYRNELWPYAWTSSCYVEGLVTVFRAEPPIEPAHFPSGCAQSLADYSPDWRTTHLIGGLHTDWRATHLIGGPLGGGPLGGGPKKSASEQIVESDARD